MKKEDIFGVFYVLLVVVALVLAISACTKAVFLGVAGTGESVGYVTTVQHYDHAAFWLDDYDLLWFRASAETSNTDCYAATPEAAVRASQFANERNTLVRIQFIQHRSWGAIGKCSPFTVTAITPTGG